ncbi:MAG TPA: 7TM diverse intracellular signaling domain-containing protein [Cytophagales bacterium]|nr:7TM diverse intracellular signaling domain-containing protein [Cytophagales bacterium]
MVCARGYGAVMMKHYKRYVCSILFILISLSKIYGQRPIVLKSYIEEIPVTREFVKVYEDKTAQLDIHQILQVSLLEKFEPSNKNDLHNINRTSAYWLKFIVVDSSRNQKDFLLEIFDFDTDEVSFFFPDGDGRYSSKKAGYGFPFSIREIHHKNIVFPLHAEASKPSVMYMRFKSNRLNVLEPIVRSNEKFIGYSLQEYMLFGIFYGIMCLVIFYNAVYLIILRKDYYLYYVVYASAVLVYFAGMNGTGFQYLWHDYYWVNRYVVAGGLGIGTISMLQFFIGFFKLRERFPEMAKLLSALVLFRAGYLIVQFTYPDNKYLTIIDILYTQLIFFFGTKLYTSGVNSTKWFIIAYSILNVFCIITFLEYLSIVPSYSITVYASYIGVMLQFVFMSVGLAESVREVYRERNNAQTELIVQYRQNEALKEKVTLELEQKVKERTLQLEQAKIEIEKRADENLRMNIALDEANYKLQKYLTSFAKSVVMNTHVDFEDFKKAYPDDLSCMRYLMELKSKKGFHCKMCGCTKAIKGKATFDVRCAKCNYNESITANTIFHRVKFPLQKAFYMVYLVSQTKSDISASELCKILELQKATCLNFKQKILERMEGNGKGKNAQLDWDHLIMDKEGAT